MEMRALRPAEINLAELRLCVSEQLVTRWRDALVALEVQGTTKRGWYRDLTKTDRIGVVATTQGLLALAAAQRSLDEMLTIIHTLRDAQREDGGWSFISNITDRSVTDATAWALLALCFYRKHLDAPVLDRGAAWLLKNAIEDGGWGICANTSRRIYSTALALRALAALGSKDDTIATRAARTLAASADPETGAWRDAENRLSIPISAHALIALHEVGAPGSFAAVKRRARAWILERARLSKGWTEGQYLGEHEAVEYKEGAGYRRIEYRHSPAAWAVTALCRTGGSEHPSVVNAVSRLLHQAQAPGGEGCQTRTSWALHDVMTALVEFRDRVPEGTDVVWANRRRVVIHKAFEGRTRRFCKQYAGRVGAAVGLLGGLLLAMALPGGVGLAWKAVAAVGPSLVLGVGSSAVYDWLKEHAKNLSRSDRT